MRSLALGLLVEKDPGKTEIHFHAGQDLDGSAVFRSRRELPFFDGCLCLFVESEAQGADHRNVGGAAFLIHHHLENYGSLDAGAARFGRIFGLNFAKGSRGGYSRAGSQHTAGVGGCQRGAEQQHHRGNRAQHHIRMPQVWRCVK